MLAVVCSTPITGGVAPGMPSKRKRSRRNRCAPIQSFNSMIARSGWMRRRGCEWLVRQPGAGIIRREYGVSDGIRTRDVQIHNLALYQAELRSPQRRIQAARLLSIFSIASAAVSTQARGGGRFRGAAGYVARLEQAAALRAPSPCRRLPDRRVSPRARSAAGSKRTGRAQWRRCCRRGSKSAGGKACRRAP